MDDTIITISSTIGAILSLAFLYFPKLNEWFAGKPEYQKQQIMLGLLSLGIVFVIGVSCSGFWGIIECSSTSIQALIIAFFKSLLSGVIANQSVHRIAPEPASVKLAKKFSLSSV